MYTIDRYELKMKDKLILSIDSLTMRESGHIVICGEIGSGKSTFAKSLINFNDYTGTIKYQGRDIKDFKINEFCNYIPQSLQYYFLMSSVIDEVKFATGASDSKIKQMLSDFHLADKEYESPNSLSGGEQIRLAMLIARLNQVEVIILDETVAMNDLRNLKIITSEIQAMKQECLVIEISHDVKRISLADQILFIDQQKIFSYDSMDALLKNQSAKHLWSEND